MQKGLSLLFIILLLGCQRDGLVVTPTVVPTPGATRLATLPTETAVSPTNTPIMTATATPTEAATARPTLTPTPTPTPVEEFVWPTLPPVAAEAGESAELYRLRAWSDAEAATLVSTMTDYAEAFKADWELYTYYGDWGRHEIMEAGQEFILRYPHSPYRTDVEWQMVDASTYSSNRPLDGLLAKLIAADLNVGVTTLETLDAYLQPRGLQITLQACPSCTPFPISVPNLLGDGREIPLFLIERGTDSIEGGVLIAIWQDEDGKFIVTPIISQWAAFTRFSGGISHFEARHITGDSRPELLIQLWGHSGSIWGSSLYMHKWDGDKFVQLPGTPVNFSGGILGEQWQFVEGDDPSRLEVIHGYDSTTTIYEWTGNSYEPVEIVRENVPSDPTNIYSAFRWIQRETERGNYTEVIAYLEEELQRPAISYNLPGTQYHRALRFVLGMNYVYLEDEEMARSIFEALRDEISPPELMGFSQAAGAFLEQYDGLDTAYAGCRTAYEVILATRTELLGVTELIPLCAFDKLFVARLSQYDGQDNVFDYVEAAEIIDAQQYDLNGDRQLDWLFALSQPTLFAHTDVDVWAALSTDVGTEVIRLAPLWTREAEVAEFSAEIHLLPSFDTPLIAIFLNNNFGLLQLIKDEEEWGTKVHTSSGIATNYSLSMVENDLQLDLFVDATTAYGGINRITYRWDAAMEKFVEVSRHAPNSLGVPFNEALTLAETLIFESGDFAAATPILTTIAHEYGPDDRDWYSILPKTLYLLGLAHELQGNQTQAVAAYWQLWHDYPTAAYAWMATAKLEEK